MYVLGSALFVLMYTNALDENKGGDETLKWVLIYRKSSIRSQPCIILNPNFPRFVLEVHQILRLLEQKFFSQVTEVTL